jgi:hypothetical protein
MKREYNHSPRMLVTLFSYLISISMLISACGLESTTPTSTVAVTPPAPTATPMPRQAVVTFEVLVPESKDPKQSISIDILDEVTGLGLNPSRFQMQATDNLNYTIRLPFTVGSIIKYRFNFTGNSSAVEYNPRGEQVRYRLYYVLGPGLVRDIVYSWGSQIPKVDTGQISGRVTNKSTGDTVPGILLAAGGLQTLTNADGSFLLEGIPTGTHNIVAYSLDGSYLPFQQGANIQAGLNTPAIIKLSPSRVVKITFNVSVPKDVAGAPIRLAGNLYQLGNTFADLSGGINTIASRMPILTPMPDGRYTITFDLPAGADLRYKYTLGDGFWNAEQTQTGQFRLRQLIVPDSDQIIDESVETWKSGNMAPITFEVKAPDNTPPSDTVSIQFNPYGWTEPIPMWSLGNNRWLYVLFGPLNLLSNLSYRYCRNDQCDSAGDTATQGANHSGWPLTVGLLAQTFQDEIKSWVWWNPSPEPTTIVASDIKPRGASFIAGIEIQPKYHPSWQPHILPMLQNLKGIGANWVLLSPSWTYPKGTSPNIELIPGQNPLWADLVNTIGQARALKLQTAIFPQPVFKQPVNQWWQTVSRDNGWWQAWFMHYRIFILNHADLCARNGVQALVLGGDWLLPALPKGILPDGKPSGVPEDTETQWRQLINEVKQRYSGSLIWAMPYSEIKNPPAFLDMVDQLYLIFSTPFATKPSQSVAELKVDFQRIIDNEVRSTYNLIKKPVIIGIDYPAVQKAAVDCIFLPDEGCVFPEQLDQPFNETASLKLDLQEQVDIYNALLSVIDQRDWISGVTTRGYYPPVSLQDRSRSLNGKPAFDVLWYWYSKMVR